MLSILMSNVAIFAILPPAQCFALWGALLAPAANGVG
jgi:hypothetical protein